jgi:predicted SnoaL-like aldol condensation-catalyzing enzyme
MQRSFILSLSAFFVMVLTLTAAGDPDQTADQNKATIRQFYQEVFDAGKADLASQYIAADAIDHEVAPGQKDPAPALANLKEFLTTFRTAFPDLKVQVARVRMTGTFKGDFNGASPNGKSFSIELIDIVRLANGKIAEHWGISDDLSMMQQLGMLPAAPAAGDTGAAMKGDNAK